jgi:small-conductance mechanosensitive channel
MTRSASILLDNALLIGPALLLLFVATHLLARAILRVLGALLRRLPPDQRDPLLARWRTRVSRAALLVTTLLSCALLFGAVLLGWYGVHMGSAALAWTEQSLLRDPVAALWRGLQVVGVLAGAVVLHRMVEGLVRLVLEALQSGPLEARRAQVEVLLQRVRPASRRAIGFGALFLCAWLLAAPPAALDWIAVFAYIVVGVALARVLVAAGHLAIDVLFGIAASLTDRDTPIRHVARLKDLAGVSKRALEYCIYVGAATVICEQLQPDTWLAHVGHIAIRVIAIVYFSRVIVEVCEGAIREVFATRDPEHTDAEHQQRQTLAPVAASLLRYAVYFCSGVMALGEFGVDTTPILAAAGLLGIAVGLGAQAFVGDLVSGFFILFEGMFLVGDRVQIGSVVGLVEEIGVRVTHVRDEVGVVHCIPNGEIRGVASHSRQYVNAIVEFNVPYDAELERVLSVVRTILADARTRHSDILDPSELVVQELREAGVRIRSVTRVRPGKDDQVSELLRADLLAGLLTAGIHPHTCSLIRLVPEPTAAVA